MLSWKSNGKGLILGFGLAVFGVLLLFAAPGKSAQAADYYVSTAGNDTTGTGALGLPWRTIQKCADTAVAGDTCFMRAGTYREMVTPVNSGSSGNPVRYKNYNGEAVVVSGADLITGWTLHSGSIYKAAMNWDVDAANIANKGNVVFVDGAYAGTAKWPNDNATDGILNPASWATVDSASGFTITDSALSGFSSGYWNNATMVCICGVSYTALSSEISSSGSSSLTFGNWPIAYGSAYAPAAGDLYHITNSLKALDTANEWYKDSGAGILYLQVAGGGSPSANAVEAKKRDYAFDLSNKSHIEINGLSLRAASVKTAGAGGVKIIGVNLQGATQNLEGSGNEIRNSEISKMYESGVLVSGDGNKVINNYIHDVDYSASNSYSAITIRGKNHLISHNTIAKGAYSIMNGSFSATVVQYNNMYDAGMITHDVGILYLGNADYGNSEIHHNWIHDNKAQDLNAAGFYADNYSSNLIGYRNVMWNSNYNILLNSPYNFNLMYNNSTYDNSNIYSQYAGNAYGTQIMNNIAYEGLQSPTTATLSHNLTFGDPLYANTSTKDFRLQSSSPARDKGTPIAGVTDGYAGSAPDIGAYEYGGADWTPGHNFTTPPSPTYGLTDLKYKNRIANAGFEFDGSYPAGSLQSWTATGSPAIAYSSTWHYGAASLGYMHYNGAALNNGDKLEQTITGLSPNTTYVLSGWGKIDGKYIQAEAYDSSFQSLSDHWSGSAGSVGPMRDGDYVGYNGIAFNSLYNRISVGIIGTKSGSYIEVRKSSSTGMLLGTINLADNDALRFEPATAITPPSGTHNLFLVFRKGTASGDLGYLDSFKLLNSSMSDSLRLGVKSYGGADVYKTFGATSWEQKYIIFTTGGSSTSAVVYLDKPSGSYVGYADNLGLVETYLPPGSSFFDSFENGFDNWTLPGGTPTTSTAQKFSGGSSFVMDEDVDAIYHTFGSNMNKVAVVRFYDDASDTSALPIAFVDDGNIIALGVDTAESTTKYIYRIGNVYTPTPINRTTGWHEFTFDYRSGTDVKLYIDGVKVAVSNTATSFNRIYLGDAWANGTIANVYFDDVSVQDDLPFIFSESFESGFGDWTVPGGTATASATQKFSGSYSYAVDEDVDAIYHTFGESLNKVAVVRFYDDASDTSTLPIAFVDDGNIIALGVDTAESTTHYIYRIGNVYTVTPIARTTGWHEFAFDYRSGTDVKLYIDGRTVAVSTHATAFNRIYLGDAWGNGTVGDVYFDDVTVLDYLPFTAPLFWDSFESGFGNWQADVGGGTASVSTAQKYSGIQSYAMDEDIDTIYRYMETNTNKVFVARFYDDASDLTVDAYAFLSGYASNGTATSLKVGADTGSMPGTTDDNTQYVYEIGGVYYTSGVTRTTGWHTFAIDLRSGTDMKLYIDGVLVTTNSSTLVSFYAIRLGDLWSGGYMGNLYFDEISVQDNLP